MRIAFISDIHVGKLATTNELTIAGEEVLEAEVDTDYPLFQGLIDILKEEKPDYLFIAGDLTSTGSPLEFKQCYEKIQLIKEEVGIPPTNIIFCLGNHDIDWRISKLADTHNLADTACDSISYYKDRYQKLAHSWSIQEGNPDIDFFPDYSETHNTPLTGVVEFPEFIAFVLNSGHLCTHDQNNKHGCLSSSQFEWFRDVIEKHRGKDKLKIVLLHHHPCNYPYPTMGLDISLLEEGSELLQLCGNAGIDLVLHGHRHHPKAETKNATGWVKPVTYICAGSLSVIAGKRQKGQIPNTFHMLEFIENNRIVLNNYRYSLSSGWELTEYSNETPVDGKMFLGDITNEKEAIDHIRNLPEDEIIKYEDLHTDLKFLLHNQLNKYVAKVFDESHHITNKFPEDVFLLRK